MGLIYPWTEGYPRLTCFDAFQAVTECLLTEQDKPLPDLDLCQKLHEEREYQRAEAALRDPIWDIEHNLYVTDLGSRKVLFQRSPGQILLTDKIEEAWRTGKPVRLIIPKSRRVWASEMVTKIGYQFITRNENVSGLMLAHDDASTIDIFRKYLFTYRNDPMAPSVERDSKNELVFRDINSQIRCRTAGSSRAGDLGRGSTLQFVHFDEAALYPINPKALITTLMATIPPEPVRSMVFVISTGNGQTGFFYEEAMKCFKGESKTWQLVFLPWHVRQDARREFESEAERDKFMASLDERERVLRDEFHLDAKQLNWYRHVYREEIKGHSPEERMRRLKQEYPSRFMECFQTTSTAAFDVDKIDLLAPACKPPSFVGDIQPQRSLWDKSSIQRVEITPKVEPSLKPEGPLAIWETVRPKVRYCMGIDLCEGTTKGDWSVIMVFRRDAPRRFVARYRARLGPKWMLTPTRLLSKYYNDALIIPEVNFAPTFIEDLKETDRRALIYWRPHPDRARVMDEFQQLFGWRTDRRTKRNLVEILRERLELEPSIFSDVELLDEMRIFEERQTEAGETVYPGAPAGEGSHDDIVIAAALALYCDHDMPKRGEGPVGPLEKPRTVGDRWNEVIDGFAAQAERQEAEPGW